VHVDGVSLGPWRLTPNRVWRFYEGGSQLERFRGASEGDARDGHVPEDWVGSVTTAWRPPGDTGPDEGLSVIEADGRSRRLRDLLAANPEAIAGRALVERAGTTTGLLVKLLDAGIRLPVHAHPSRAFARAHLDSFFGKAEAWHVLSTHHVQGAEAPNLRLGFRRPVERDDLIGIIERGETDRLLELMHERPARPGDTWFVPPGLPHAIGAGVFIVELQEPTDFSIVAETRGVPIDPADAHLRLGWDTAIEALDRDAKSDADIDALRQVPGAVVDRGGVRRQALTGADADPFFRAERVTVRGQARPGWEPAFLIAVVTAGSGVAIVGEQSLAIARGDTFAVPAAVLPDLELQSADGLEVVACLPPRPWDLGNQRQQA
jgi:mannose-6-phosphate isomerase